MDEWRKLRYKDKRDREYLTPLEFDALKAASKEGRHGVRDLAMCLMMTCHALRVSELIGLTIGGDLIMDDAGGPKLMVTRLKWSMDTCNWLEPEVLRALRKWLKVRKRWPGNRLFVSERGSPFTRQALFYLVKSWGDRACLPFPVHPHMLRHTCGHFLANTEGAMDTRRVQEWLGHADIRNTVKYTALSPEKFRGIWGQTWK